MRDGWPIDSSSRFPGTHRSSLGRGVSVLKTSLLHLQYIPSMMASYDWRVRHAGLMAIAAIGEGTGKVG
jgi:hypothetical protein